MEKDNEWTGSNSHLDFGARIHDTRIGRLLSIDPEARVFPNLSTYSYAANNPIAYVDKEGKHRIFYVTVITDKGSYKQTVIKKNTETDIKWENTPDGGRFYPVEPVTFITMDLRTDVPEAEKKDEVREGAGRRMDWSEWVSQSFETAHGGTTMEGGIMFVTNKDNPGAGKGPGVTSNAESINVVNLDEMTAAIGAAISALTVNPMSDPISTLKTVKASLESANVIMGTYNNALDAYGGVVDLTDKEEQDPIIQAMNRGATGVVTSSGDTATFIRSTTTDGKEIGGIIGGDGYTPRDTIFEPSTNSENDQPASTPTSK